MVAVLSRQPAGLVTDVDGTISPIAAVPAEARVLPQARAALQRLARRLALVAVVSGRSVADAQRLVGLDGLTYVGNHGLELVGPHGPQPVEAARPYVPLLAAALDQVAPQLTLAGILVENKGVSASLHYRLAVDREAARRQLLDALAHAPAAQRFRLEEGRLVVNLLPPIPISKGTVVRLLATDHRLRALVYLGDDVTDLHAFRALRDLRETAGLHTLALAVGTPEAAAEVHQAVDARLPSPRAAAALLADVAAALPATGLARRAADVVAGGTSARRHARAEPTRQGPRRRDPGKR